MYCGLCIKQNYLSLQFVRTSKSLLNLFLFVCVCVCMCVCVCVCVCVCTGTHTLLWEVHCGANLMSKEYLLGHWVIVALIFQYVWIWRVQSIRSWPGQLCFRPQNDFPTRYLWTLFLQVRNLTMTATNPTNTSWPFFFTLQWEYTDNHSECMMYLLSVCPYV